eukprot:Clim_evm63s77 gene=Clim_evmTU63s77
MAKPTLYFYYDVVCPFAYMGFLKLDGLIQRTGAEVIFRPTLLGGLYDRTKAPQGKDGSATDGLPAQKLAVARNDLRYQLSRINAPLHWHPRHPVKSLNAMRLLCGIDDKLVPQMTQALYEAYWVKSLDVDDPIVLQQVASTVTSNIDASALITDQRNKDRLRDNTEEALQRGAFGVPGFYVPDLDYFCFGQDRMHFVERALGNSKAVMPRRITGSVKSSAPVKLTFWYDFSSPWSYLGSTQFERMVDNVRAQGANVQVEYVPFLLGALFRAIGTPMMPAMAVSQAKREYMELDLQRWAQWWDVNVKWNTHFPIRSVFMLRMLCMEPEDHVALRLHLYKACWDLDLDMSKEEVVMDWLEKGGFDSRKLKALAESQEAKDKLKYNTERAINGGVCGVPSYQVNDGDVIWGQDRMDVVQDLICGWQANIKQYDEPAPTKRASL